MRLLLIVIFLAAAIWAGLWFAGASALRSGLDDVAATPRVGDAEVTFASHEVAGFPNRLDTFLTDLRVTDTPSQTTLTAAQASVYALIYRPQHLIAQARTLGISWPGATMTAAELEASAVARARPNLPFDRATVILSDIALDTGVPLLETPRVRLAARQAVGSETAYDVALAVEDLSFAPEIIDLFQSAPAEPWAPLRLDLTLAFNRPLDRHARSDGVLQVTDLEVRPSVAAWGTMKIAMEGKINIAGTGLPEGRIEIALTDWERMLTLAEESGALPERFLIGARRVLETLSEASEDPESVDIPLSFQNGFMSLGPLPLGRISRISR